MRQEQSGPLQKRLAKVGVSQIRAGEISVF
jgi:hypothetical protein